MKSVQLCIIILCFLIFIDLGRVPIRKAHCTIFL